MIKQLALIGLLSFTAGIPQDQSNSTSKRVQLSSFLHTPPNVFQSIPPKVLSKRDIVELLKQYGVVQNASGSITIQQQNLNDNLSDTQVLKEFPIHVIAADASKYRILSSPVPRSFNSKMPVNIPKIDIDPQVIIELQKQK